MSLFALLPLTLLKKKTTIKSEFWKMKQIAGDIIILYMFNKNHNHEAQFLRYRVKQTELFVILGRFLLFYLPNNRENPDFEKNEKHIWKFQIMIIWCMPPEMWSVTDIIFCHFGLLFASLSHCWHWKLKFRKNAKETRRYPFTRVFVICLRPF